MSFYFNQVMQRLTKQKRLLQDTLTQFTSFFDAYELHNIVVKKNPNIGLATIYRFLNALEFAGELHSFLCDNKKIYSLSKTNHAHFKCEKCGIIKHIKIKNLDFLSEFKQEQICHFQIELHGVCEKCREKS